MNVSVNENAPAGTGANDKENEDPMSADIVSKRLDDLRIVTLEGEEWSARDLLPLAGYKAWQDWSKAINRAMKSINASGLVASDHFRESPKLIEAGKGARRAVEDYRITRYGCYILFQNADGSKPEIAAVQQYFAVQTRKQELLAPELHQLTDDEIVAQALQITTAKVKALEAKVEADAPKVLFADAVTTSQSTCLVGELAKILHGNGVEIGQNRLFARLREDGFLIRRQGTDFNMPTQRAMELGLFKIKETAITHSDGHVTVNRTPKVTGKGQQYFVRYFVKAAA